MTASNEDYAPPPGPPPLLSRDELFLLMRQGWLLYDLPIHIENQIDELTQAANLLFKKDAPTKVAAVGGRDHEDEGWYDVPGEKEYLTFRRASASDSLIERLVDQVWSAVSQLLHRILCDMSRAGGLDASAWHDILAGSSTLPPSSANLRDITSIMRLFKYLPGTGNAAQHTDLGLLTLCVGSARGLEVLDQAQHTWIDASRCVILVGATLSRLSGGNFGAGVHRVVSNPEGRQSFVFALRPNLSAVVDGSAFALDGTLELRKIFLDIKGRKYNVNARPEVRALQQERQREAAKQSPVEMREVPTNDAEG